MNTTHATNRKRLTAALAAATATAAIAPAMLFAGAGTAYACDPVNDPFSCSEITREDLGAVTAGPNPGGGGWGTGSSQIGDSPYFQGPGGMPTGCYFC
jgi:hypothetical protein